MVSKAVIICILAFIGQAISEPSCYKAISSKLASSPKIAISPKLLASSSSSGSCQSIVISNSGGELLITAVGPISPSGIAVATELGLAGDLVVSGELPYLSAVAFEGQFDTSGAVPVAYGCGDCVAITQEIGNPSGANANLKSGSSKIISCGCA